jgi:hypothetical protein
MISPTPIDGLMVLAMCVVLARCICVAPKLSRTSWSGHRAHFVALAGTYALLAGGAVGTALHWPHGQHLLLAAVAGWVLFDRRAPR